MAVIEASPHRPAAYLAQFLPARTVSAIKHQLVKYSQAASHWGRKRGERDELSAWPADTDFRLCR